MRYFEVIEKVNMSRLVLILFVVHVKIWRKSVKKKLRVSKNTQHATGVAT